MDIDFDNIEVGGVDSGGGMIYHYLGEPFTGTIVEFKNNVLIGETSVVVGHTQGRVALYYDSGQIYQEYFKKYNNPYGLFREWNEAGNLISEHNFGPEPTEG